MNELNLLKVTKKGIEMSLIPWGGDGGIVSAASPRTQP